MAISFNHIYGDSSIRHNNSNGIDLVSDGKTLALQWDASSYILDGFAVTSMEVIRHHAGVHLAGDSFMTQVPTGQRVNINLTSTGPVKIGPASALNTLFCNANDLPVEELLKLAYQKIDARAEVEENLTNDTEVSL